jgi:hypothetical protein
MSFSHLLLYASAYSFPVLRGIFVAFPCVIFLVNCFSPESFYDGLYNVLQIDNDYVVFCLRSYFTCSSCMYSTCRTMIRAPVL